MSLAAWIASVPLAAWHFGLFSPYGQLLTAALTIPVAAVLVPGYLSLALAWPAPNLSEAFANLADLSAGGLERLVGLCSHLPGLCLEVRPVGPAWAAMCYAAVGLWLGRKRLPWGTAAAGAATVLLAGWTVWTQLPAPAPEGLQLDLLAVGDGQCAIVRTSGGRTALFDAGTRSTLDVERQVLTPFLRDRRLPAPSDAFVSHANSDHYSAVAELAAQGRLRRVYLNEYFAAPGEGGAEPEITELEFLRLLQRHGVRIERLAAGDVVDLDEHMRVEVLWPPPRGNAASGPAASSSAASAPATRPSRPAGGAKRELDVNDTSLVLRVVHDRGESILLPGDAGEIPQAALAAGDANRLRCDVLVLPHHGSWSDALPAFHRAARPRATLVSRASEPRVPASGSKATTRAAGDFYARLQRSDQYCSTARRGWIRASVFAGEVKIETMR